MIDWGKFGPGNSPTPSTPDTTAPVAPAVPGSLPGLPQLQSLQAPGANQPHYGDAELTDAERNLTQEQVDKLDIGQRLGRGWDMLGDFLFGEKSALHDTVIKDVVGAGGNVLGGAADLAVVKPLEAGATLLHSVPLGWLPGGADESFTQIGDWAKANDPMLYAEWQKVDAAAKGNWYAGDLHADFNTEALKYIDDQHYESALGTDPTLAIGRAGVGSLGDAFTDAVGGWLGLLGGEAQKALGDTGFFDATDQGVYGRPFEDIVADAHSGNQESLSYLSEEAKAIVAKLDSGEFTEPQAREWMDKLRGEGGFFGSGRSRVEGSALRAELGLELSDVEQKAVDAWKSGAWSLEHANQWIVSHGQGVSSDPLAQIVGSVATDPLTYASVGAGSIAKAGTVGARLTEAGFQASNAYERAALAIRSVQQSQLGPAFRIARGLVDPLAVYKPSAVARATTDLRNGVALEAFQRAYGPQTVTDLRRIAREVGLTTEVDSALASYSIDQANLMIARKVQRDMLEQGLGEELVQSAVDDVIDPLAQRAGRDAVTELTDHMMATSKNTLTAEEEAHLAGRIASTLGGDVATWEKKLAGMSFDLKSALHAITYKLTEVNFEQARALLDQINYMGDLPLRNMVLMTADTLDDVTAGEIVASLRAGLKGAEEGKIGGAIKTWNDLARRYPTMANLGHATGGNIDQLVKELEKTLQSGGITRRVTEEELADGALRPIRDMLDRHIGADGKPLWKVGFRPDEEVAWGLKRDVSTGRYVIDRDPTISHVVDAVPGRQPFSDTTRNVLGQVIGKSKAERLNRPIESIEAMSNTMRDMVTGRRLVLNIERRFERTMFGAGVPKALSKEIMAKAREAAGLDYSTVRGIKPDNLWNAIHEIVPRNLVLKDGSHLNVHIVMDHLLTAAEGDLRIMGVTSVLSQRMRNALRQAGLNPANWMGQMTVTMYNKLRYSQPMFLIQRITDAPYYSILYGVTPVGKGALTGAKAELAKITENLGKSGLARDFSMDMPEYATRSNFTAGIKSAAQQAGLKANWQQRIMEAPDTIIANNMTNMTYARLGNIVRGTLDNLAEAAEKGDPALKAEMLQAGEGLQRSFADWRRVYSEQAGRALTDDEVGLKYIQDQLNAWRRHVVNEDGTLDFSRLIAEGERAMPSNVGEMGPIKPDILAQELGYADSAALRRDVTGHIEKVGGVPQLIPGESSLAELEEKLAEQLHAHPDYVRRAMAYYSDTWEGFWTRLSKGVDEGGLDISQHYAREAQDLIAITARERGMDPWEYLSGVMAMNIGATDLETHMGQLIAFLKSGKAKQPLSEWTKMFRATLDPSAQTALLKEFESAVDIDAVVNTLKPGAFGTKVPRPGAPAVATLPAGYTTEAGYVYRIETLATARGGWPKRTGVSTEANPMYVRGDPGEGVFRSKIDPANLNTGRHGAGGKDRLTGKATPPEQIEMLDANGNWVPLGEDPMVKIMAKDFPEAVKQRIISGVPHPDPEIEGYMQALSKWVQDAIGPDLGTRTRADLRRLVEAVPTTHATSFNRTQALVVSLLKDKIKDAQQDVFRLAEMQTQRSVLERSLNHPLFGLYPASYMWGKVLPESLKFFARNPYAATYAIADVQRSIAIQREYNRDMEDTMNTVDRSSAAFLLDYLTPGLPWNAHDARMSPMVRKLLEGKPEDIWTAELATVSPERWISSIAETVKEGLDFASEANQPPPPTLPGLDAITGTPAIPVNQPGTTTQITGPTKAGALAPILADDLSRLQSILLEGASPEE